MWHCIWLISVVSSDSIAKILNGSAEIRCSFISLFFGATTMYCAAWERGEFLRLHHILLQKNTMRYRAKDASRTYIVQVPRTNHTNTQKIWFIRIQKHTYDIELFCAIILCFPFWKVLLQPSNFVILISSHILLSSWAFLICDLLYPYVGGWFLGGNACWHLIDTETKHMV